MFGQPDNNQQATTTATASNPSMLDNVSSNDLQAGQTQEPAATSTTPATTTPDPAAAQSAAQHPLTTDNPFAQTPAPSSPTPDPTPTTSDPVADSPQQPSTDPTAAPSEPAAAPVFQVDDVAASSGSNSPSSAPIPTEPVDHDKLASMKQEAMGHLEPLVDHIDGSPEETFKTTMMMIQANDNHLLLDKALESAKNITDDKARAEALLDIINEINYFSQANSQ